MITFNTGRKYTAKGQVYAGGPRPMLRALILLACGSSGAVAGFIWRVNPTL